MAQSKGGLGMEEEIKNEYRGVVYCYTNTVNGKMYVGKTTDEKRRRREHKIRVKKGEEGPFYDAVREDGWDTFTYEILVDCIEISKEDLKISLNKAESYYINILKVQGFILYNRTKGGDGGGGFASEDFSKNLSKRRKGMYTGGDNFNAKKVQYLLDGKIFECAKDAAKYANVSYRTMLTWLEYKPKPKKGWIYYDENITEEERDELILETKKHGSYKDGFKKRVIGPDGIIYESIKKASIAAKVPYHVMKRWLNHKPEKGWSYYTEEN